MNKKIEKKLLHFYTGGNIRKDFDAARRRKTSKLRRVIRACFYAHFAAAVVCITLAAVLGAGTAGIVAVSLCEVLLLGLAFLAVGDMTAFKTLLCCGDTAFSAAMFVTGALLKSGNRTAFFAVGAVSVVITLCAFGALYAAMCREFLDSFPPLSLREEHYTLLPQLAEDDSDDEAPDEDYDEDYDSDDDDSYNEPSEDSSADAPEEYRPKRPPAPPKSESRLLAERLREILCAPKDDMVADAMPKPPAESAPVIPEAIENSNNSRIISK